MSGIAITPDVKMLDLASVVVGEDETNPSANCLFPFVLRNS